MSSLSDIYDNFVFDNSIVHIEVQKGSRLHRRVAHLIPENYERILFTRSDSM